MTRAFILSGLLTATGVMGMMLGPISSVSAYTYSSTLIARYTAGCSSKLTAKGKSADQAQRMCQCSINQMQSNLSQSQAIALLIKSQFSGSIDSNTGLPTALSPYFESCMS
ncbi:MAG: hypothetical protein WCD18_00980 [Thermosynechococcaceae cyanobacterium]